MDAHIIDSRGVYLRTETIDPMGPQPPGAVYEALPGKKSGKTRVWDGAAWQQVANADVPPLPEAPGPEPDPVPHSCTRRQGQRALLVHGHLDDVEAAIAAIADPLERRDAQIEYEAHTWERGNPFVQAMWAQLGGTPEQLDDLFRMAVTL
ncbi:hypothetical protein [Acidovorax sp. CCYZU-2555]|uniref:hypothetical protein n=1 Tax=Acidovorax sp. CCYZU-2555 TaxID=2835042 RepID=UPI001BCB6BE8|nr:hypothetical protein [Acidovorax sp. CCYZU-2555]MBS7777709.1 hypothetical protein [Acidovorax sp. CCYZU-2555]